MSPHVIDPAPHRLSAFAGWIVVAVFFSLLALL